MGNLLDTAKPFAEKFGKVFFYIAAVALVFRWGYMAYSAAADSHPYAEVFYAGRFFGDLLVNAPWTIVQIGLVRLFIELVISSSKNGQQA